MPTFYNFTEGGLTYSFDDVFVPADMFREGNLWIWGQGTYGKLGNGATTGNISTPVTTFSGGTNWKQVSSGNQHTAAIKTDGTLWTWGNGGDGKLGTNDITNRSTPVTTFSGGTNWKQVSCGRGQVAAIKTDGTLWGWGLNTNRELGDNSATTRSTPVTTFAGGTNWKQVSCGAVHTAAVKTDGTLWTWGQNNSGKLGTNNQTVRATPGTTFAGGIDWKQVACAYNHTAAIKTDGTLWIWGNGGNGQLGNAQITDRFTPVTTFAGGTNWKQVAVSGSNHKTAAIKTDGTLWTWGNCGNGNLGNGIITGNISTPVTTFAGGTNWKQVSCGYISMAAIKTDGTLWTWGSGNVGRLGTNDQTDRSTPVTTFAGGTNWKQVNLYNAHVGAVFYEDPVI